MRGVFALAFRAGGGQTERRGSMGAMMEPCLTYTATRQYLNCVIPTHALIPRKSVYGSVRVIRSHCSALVASSPL